MFDYAFKRKKTWASVFLLDLIGSFLFFFRNREVPKEIRRILVIRLDHLGDLVMSTPFFTKLRELYPAAEIHLLTDAAYVNLFDRDERFDQVIGLEGHWFSRTGGLRWFPMLRRAMELRQWGYDLGFDLRGDIRTIFFFLLLAGVKYRVSYGIRGGGFMLSHAPMYPSRTHEIERNLNLLSSFTNREIQPVSPSLEVGPEIKKLMQIKLEKLGRNPSKKLIGAHLGAGYPSKQWGLEKYQRVLGSLLDQGAYQICLLGKKEEFRLDPDFLSGEDVLDSLGATSIKELAALMSLCDFFIGNDSGPAHIAAALGVPVLSVFSGTNRPEEFKPWAPNSEILHKDLECSPCEEKICPLGHHHCMSLITEDEVLERFRKLADRVGVSA